MKRRALSLLLVFLSAASISATAFADPIDVGYFSYDVSGNLAQFDIFNGTGPNSFDPDFPIVNTVSLSSLRLTVGYAGGLTKTFGSSYFVLSGDGLSFDGTPFSIIEPYPNGFANATSATLTGLLSTSVFTFSDGSKHTNGASFSATIFDPTGLVDGDNALIQPTPEPNGFILAGTGLFALFFLRRRFFPALAGSSASGASKNTHVALGLGCALLLASSQTGNAQAVKLGTWTSPDTGASGTSAVNITGSGFPSGSISPANVTLSVATACAGSGPAAVVNSVSKIVGSTERVQFVLPASLATGTYFISLSGTTSTGSAFASTTCAEVNVTGSSPTATLSASAITFPTFAAGTSAPGQSMNVTNTGTGTLNISSVALSGVNAGVFTQSNNCTAAIGPGSFCTVTANLNPKIAGSYSATITITGNTSPTTQTVSLNGTATPFVITIDTTNSTDWKINNGALTLDYLTTKGRIGTIHLAGYPDNLVDLTSSAPGIYMDNSGFGSGTTTFAYTNAGTYLDFSATTASNATNAYTYTTHYLVFPNDPGIHTYFVANHAATDIAGGIGQVQWVYRSDLNDFNNTYSLNADLSNPNPVKIQRPPIFPNDVGRNVQDATTDLHGIPLPASFIRQFDTKYDYSTYNYLHQAHGTYGSTYGVWSYFPSNESLVAGPTKQNLIFTGNLCMIEAFSNHLDNSLSLATPAGTASNRLFGPYYYHFNTIGGQTYTSNPTPINTPDDMYADTLQAGASFIPLYDSEQPLLQAGYIPSTNRGAVSLQVANVIGAPKTAWAVLSDPGKNIQYSSAGYQYWADISASGSVTINGVAPGTYRLSAYDLGKFGEYRQDGIVVTANQTTTVPPVAFVPETFGGETVFTIGTPDRSSHEFLHGHDAQGFDMRDYWGSWNYWADFAANKGAVLYNATAGPNGPATNDLSQWNYNHWGSSFDPGLFGGVYNSSDDTTDGYIYAIPTYVAALPGAKGTNGVLTGLPSWQVHFASPADVANYQYAILSVAVACVEGSYVTTLNNSTNNRTWSFTNASDCAIRSGLSGYTQWIAFEFPASELNAAGLDNTLAIGISQVQGAMDDALRLELTNTSANPTVTGWHDYEYVPTRSTANDVHANDTLANP